MGVRARQGGAVIGDLVAKTLVLFQADTSDLKAKLKDLKGQEKELAQQQIESANQRNAGLKSWVDGLAKANQALELVGRVVEVAEESLKTYGDQLRLQAAAGSVDIGKLQDAFSGLISRHETLQFAAQATHGVMKLTQDQMGTVGQAFVSLTRAGFDQEETFKKLEDAVVSLKTNGLDDLGISVQQGKTNAETLKNVIDALNAKVKENGELMSSEAEDIQRTSVAWKDAKESLEAYIGATIAGKAAFAQDRGGRFDALNMITGGFAAEATAEVRADEGAIGLANATARIGDELERLDSKAAQVDSDGTKLFGDLRQGASVLEYGLGILTDKVVDWGEKAKKSYEKAREAAQRLREEQKTLSITVSKQLTDDLVKRLEGEVAQDRQQFGTLNFADRNEYAKNNLGIDLDAQINAINSKVPENKPSVIEKLFGSTDEMSAYKEALSGLFGAAASGLDAMIIGSDAGAKSFAKSTGSILHSLAVQEMTFGFAKEGEAIADLISLNPAKAAVDAAAGAKYLATGIAIDAVAKGLGYSGSSPPKGSGGGGSGSGTGAPSAGGGTSSSAPQQKQAVIVIGEAFANDTPRMRQLKAKQLVDRAYGSAGFEDS